MKKIFFVDCHTVTDTMYESEKDSSLSLFSQLQMNLHLLFCRGCAAEMKNLSRLEEIMKTDFLPPSPSFEDFLMERVYSETGDDEEMDAPVGFSFRGWVIIGFFMLLSFSTAFFGMNFDNIAKEEGLSFLLPVGLTIGMILTCYGALFIGSHLKELSSRFGLR